MSKTAYINKINGRLKYLKSTFGSVGVFHDASELVSDVLGTKMTASGYLSAKNLTVEKIAQYEKIGGSLDFLLETIGTSKSYLDDAASSFKDIDDYDIKKKRISEPRKHSKKELISEANAKAYISAMHHDTLKNQYLSIMQMDEQLIDDVGTIQLEKLPYYLQSLYQDYEDTLGKGTKGKRSYTQMQKMYDTGATFVNAVKAWKEFNGKK